MFDPLHKWLGIPPSEQPPNDYRLLGLADFEDDPEVIDSAADRDLTFLHDLTNGEYGDMAEELSNRVSAARVRLLNKEKKAAYDAELRAEAAQNEIDVDSVIDSLGGAASPTPKTASAADVLGMPPGVHGAQASDASTTADSPPASAAPIPPQHAPAQQSPTQQAPANAPQVHTKSKRKGRRGKKSSLIWLLAVGPSTAILGYLIYMIATGGLQLDQDKLEKIGVPKEQAEQLAGMGAETDRSDPSATETNPSPGGRPSMTNPNGQIAAGGQTKPSASPKTMPPSRVPPDNFASSPEPSSPSPSMNFRPDIRPPVGSPTPDRTSPRTPSLAEYLNPKKTPIPTNDEIEAKLKTVRDLYYQDYLDAKTRDDKVAIADQMRLTAIDTKNDPGGQFALFRVARDIYIREGDYASAIIVIELIDESFDDVDVLRLKREVLAGVENSGTSSAEFCETSIILAEDCLRAGRVHEGIAVCENLRTTVKRIPPLQTARFKALKEQLLEAKALFESYEQIALILEKEPDNADARSTAGTYLCIVENRWDEGLPHLAQGSDLLYQKAARKELSADSGAATDLQIADAWYEIIDASESDLEKRALADHTKNLYQSARQNSSGLEVRKIDQRLILLNALATPGPLSTSRIRAEQRAAAAKARIDAKARAKASKPRVIQTRTFDSPSSGDFATISGNTFKIGMSSRSSYGEAAAGVEFENVGSVGVIGTASHQVMTTSSTASKVGFYIDYHTANGYSKRVFLNCSTNTPSSFSAAPPWGTARPPDDRDFLPVSRQYTIDLEKWAPSDWDGKCWFSVYMQNAGMHRMLTTVLSWNGRSNDSEGK